MDDLVMTNDKDEYIPMKSLLIQEVVLGELQKGRLQDNK